MTVTEMKAFFGVLILMGVKQLPRIKDYWSTKNFYIQSNIAHVFTLVMYLNMDSPSLPKHFEIHSLTQIPANYAISPHQQTRH